MEKISLENVSSFSSPLVIHSDFIYPTLKTERQTLLSFFFFLSMSSVKARANISEFYKSFFLSLPSHIWQDVLGLNYPDNDSDHFVLYLDRYRLCKKKKKE